MKKLSTIIICVILATALIPLDKALSASEINKKLELKKNYSHLLSFNEKIIRYRIGDQESFEIEILPDIFNNRHEMLVRPLREIKTNLLVWTPTHIYNFDIEAEYKRGLTEFFNFKSNENKLSGKTKSVLNDYEIDLPPFLPEKAKMEDFELDLPPEIN